jgi:hypothetical protein
MGEGAVSFFGFGAIAIARMVRVEKTKRTKVMNAAVLAIGSILPAWFPETDTSH